MFYEKISTKKVVIEIEFISVPIAVRRSSKRFSSLSVAYQTRVGKTTVSNTYFSFYFLYFFIIL